MLYTPPPSSRHRLPPARGRSLQRYTTVRCNALHPSPFPSPKNTKYVVNTWVNFFQAQNAPKPVFGRGSAPDPAGGAYDAPPDTLVGWEGEQPLPIPLTPRRRRRLDLAAIPLLLKEISYANDVMLRIT